MKVWSLDQQPAAAVAMALFAARRTSAALFQPHQGGGARQENLHTCRLGCQDLPIDTGARPQVRRQDYSEAIGASRASDY